MDDKKPLFLIVEDEQAMSRLMEVMLHKLDCDVESVPNAKEALARLQSPANAGRFDALFVDIMMPEMNGFELVQKLKEMEHTATIPVIMLTALTSHRDVMLGYQVGADYYLNKPVTMEQLTYALDLVLGEPEDEGRNPGRRYYLRDE